MRYTPLEDSSREEGAPRYCCGSLCNPRSHVHRYGMLFFICLMSFGSYYCFDNPAALQDAFLMDLHLTMTQFMNLYAFYSWPNVILSLVGGFFIDRVIGIRWGAIFFASTIFVGQCLFALGAFVSSIYLMYFSRLIYGIGGESLSVAQNAYATAWYTSSELNFVFGLSLSMARIGSTINMNTMRPLYKALGSTFHITGSEQMGLTLFVASVTCLFSIGCTIALAYFYKRYLKAQSAVAIRPPQSQPPSYNSIDETPQPSETIVQPTVQVEEEEDRIKLRDILHFPAPIWLICIICVAYYVTVFPFISLGLVFFKRKYGLEASEAAAVNSLVFVVSAVASPLVGAMVAWIGYSLIWVTSGVALSVICHGVFAFVSTGLPPAVTMCCLGLSYSVLASSLWPLVGAVLPQYQRATAYGLIQSVQNLGLGLISLLAGYIADTKGYLMLELFFILCASVALLAAMVLMLWDLRNGRNLNAPSTRCRRRKVVTSPVVSPVPTDTTPLLG
ncbi:Major facilitator superfamily domain-containing protein 1 [Echinococcus granulosus]|uniref:Lysosomal dipeptide transporter MFSD1 n=1 Tax=Echinococcus granulosus TaxID=6210 RepID=U6JBS6_ECHGR|nr:Major facilitator superfamily domain-containing protein [Echinococcus granulosus]EUB56828.1 Major facilitator superfamily domain-containing protein [Echinococcus granulosus]KAH9278648.1 Major facilitator superfamily domain-containing protein 1 [Echinococcus granulosus]CDS21489.1 major facilitator superfamily domain containing protein [Echinococcus granulosus]